MCVSWQNQMRCQAADPSPRTQRSSLDLVLLPLLASSLLPPSVLCTSAWDVFPAVKMSAAPATHRVLPQNLANLLLVCYSQPAMTEPSPGARHWSKHREVKSLAQSHTAGE